MAYSYPYPHPSVTVDILLCYKNDIELSLLLIKRKNDPYKDCWALPGGFVDEHEPLIEAARRELLEETSINFPDLKQFRAYGDKDRDPRGHTISIVYYAFICGNKPEAHANDDAKELKWFALNQLPPLAFDHKKIIDEFITEWS